MIRCKILGHFRFGDPADDDVVCLRCGRVWPYVDDEQQSAPERDDEMTSDGDDEWWDGTI